MANINEAFDVITHHADGVLLYGDGRITIPQINLYNDISGVEKILNEIQGKRNQALELDEYVLQTDSIINKFKFYKSAYDTNIQNIKTIKKKLAEMDTVKASYLEHFSMYHNLLLGFLHCSQETFNSLTKCTNALQEVQEEMRKGILENLHVSLRKCEEDMEINLCNMNKLRACISAGIKSVLPEGEVKQNLCTICLEKEVDTCIVPCGHTFCQGCITNSTHIFMTNATCPTCRSNINQTIKFYLN